MASFGGPSVFKDMGKLDFDYLPPGLPHREAQLDQLTGLFRPVLQGGRQTAFLIGSVGTGKTAVAKHFSKLIMEAGQKHNRRVDAIYVNCRRRSSDKAVLLQLVRYFDKHFPDRGFSSSEMIDTFARFLVKNNTHALIILDEADVLLKKKTDLVYLLSRFDEETGSSKKSVSVMLISQQDLFPLMDSASASTFGRTNIISFGKYSNTELLSILEQRIDLAFKPGRVEPEVGDLIADIASEWGDARYAIELLTKAGMAADDEHKEEVGAEHARAAKAHTHSIVTDSKLAELDIHKKLVLLACARSLKNKAYSITGDIEKNYHVACEGQGEEARKHTQFWKYIKDLEALGLVDTKVSHGQGGTTTMVTIRDIPVKVLEEKLMAFLGGIR
ncbi:MAG: AAA family ATPase [Thermoplasmata archaeon]|nr:AAA family ATPase [Thermoplasmata archaeon]